LNYQNKVVPNILWIMPFLGSLAFGQNGALRLTEPLTKKDHTVVTSEPAISLKGTLAWTGGDRRVLWMSNRGFSDLASVALADDHKTVIWSSTAPVPLRPGVNHLRIRALGQPGAAAFVNVFYAPRTPLPTPVLGTTSFEGKQITYEVKDGLAIYQSDMVLGSAAQVAAGKFTGRLPAISPKRTKPDSITIGPNPLSATGLWPVVNGVVRVPYTNPSLVNAANINAAIAESNAQMAGVVEWVPATASDVNLVEFDFDPGQGGGGCESAVGMVGGTQYIGGSYTCTTTTILHEMGHALGLFHEQSRADRNSYVNYLEQNIDKPQHGNFDIIGSSSVDSGLYNYASIMEYGPFEFARDGVSPVLETIPAGMVLSTALPQYTTGDLDGIMRLYGRAPTAITVDTNPSGLQVLVDGAACTAPCVFSTWAIGSQHTLSVPLDAHGQTLQTLNLQNYIFGRWNAGAPNAQSVTVTNSAGNGTLLSPTTSPAISNYLASFIPVHPYNPVVAPGGEGTITSSPPPSSLIINGSETNYYQDRTLVTLTVNPAAGWSFYFWYNLAEFSLYANPYAFYVTTDLDYYDFDSSYPVTAGLENDAVTTITAASPDLSSALSFPGFAIGVVDGNGNIDRAYTPRNYDAAGDGAGFAAGAKLTLCGSTLNGSACPATPVAQSPVTTNIDYLFSQWSGAAASNADGLNVTVAAVAGQKTYTATYAPSFRTIILPSATCGGNEVTASPAGTNSIGAFGILDAFFPIGTVDFTATAGNGLAFAGWSQDLSGSAATLAYPLTGQIIGTANFNAAGTTAPLAITGVSPATPTVTSGAVNLVVTGTGFTTNPAITYTYIVQPNGYFGYRSNTLTSASQLTIQLNAGDLATAGYYQIVVLNVGAPGGQTCNPEAFFTFPVANAGGAPALGITKSHVGNFGQGQQNAQYTVSVSNIGKGPTADPVTVTENVPGGETLVSMAGSGWTCPANGNTCTRADSLAAGLSYGAITVTVNVAANASSPQINSVTVSGGGAASATATDSTTVVAEVAVPNVVGDTQSAATTAIQNAGLVVGTVTMMASGTLPVGSVISESPAAGSMVVAGSAVNLVVSSGPGGPPTVVSIAPSSGTGLTETFAAVYSDPNGTADLNAVYVLFNTSVNSVGACYVYYSPASKLMYLKNDAGTVWSAGVTPGSSGQASNSQCTLAGMGSSVSTTGNNLTFNVAITFSASFAGLKNSYLYVAGKSASSAWVQKGTWTPVVAGPPTPVSITPSSGTGLTQTFAAVYSDPNGTGDLAAVYMLFNTSVNSVGACYVYYSPSAKLMYLKNDAGTIWSAGVTPGSSSEVSNSQCTLTGTGSSVSTSGNNLTFNAALTFSGSFGGLKNSYLYVAGKSASSAWVQEGNWTPVTEGPPTVISLAPSSGTGSTQTFTAVYADPNGIADLEAVYVLFNTSVNSVGACYVYYNPSAKLMYLKNDAGTVWSAGVMPGSSSQVSNSQCTLTGTGSSVSTAGDNLTFNAALTFNSSFTRQKNSYLYVAGRSGNSAWVQKGTWTP